MKVTRIQSISIFTFLMIGVVFQNSQAQNSAGKSKNYRPNQKYELADTTASIDIEGLSKTIDHHIKIIEQYPDEPFIPFMLFELAESHASKSQFEFKQFMKTYDTEITKFEKGEILTEPFLPRVSYKQTIELCYQLLEKYPDIQFKDKVLYRLAICHLDEGNQEKAKEYFQRLLFETPQSAKISEGHFRLGEHFFNQRDFHKAIEHYSYLLEHWNDPYFNMALYKMGWAYFNINDYSNAISTYIYLISDISLLESMNTELLGKTKADVRNEAIEYIAHSLTEYGGPETAKKLFSAKDTQSYSVEVFLRMSEIYKKRNFFTEAIQTYESLLALFPLYPQAPLIQKEIIQCYEKDMEEEKAIQAKDVFVEKYGPNSQWINNYPEGKVRNDAIELSEEMLFSLGTYYQTQAQEKNRKREYQIAIQKYEDFLNKFKHGKNAAKVNYYLAECYYSIEEYDKAAVEYDNVMTLYDSTEYKDAAAYNRILSYYQLLKTVSKKDSLTFYIEDFLASGGALTPVKVSCETQANLLKACNDFVKNLPDSKNLIEVLMKYAETLYELQQWRLAARTYEKVADDKFKDSPYYGQAMNMVAQTYFKLKDYQESEKWFNKIAVAFPDSTQYVKKARTMVASANFKLAEQMRDTGESTKAAVKFLTIAFNTSDPEIAKAALTQAAGQFEQAGDLDKAVKSYERMIDEQPNISFVDELYVKSGLLYEKMQNFVRASDNYIKMVQLHPRSKFAPSALLYAAKCYEQMKLMNKAKETYQRYVNEYPLDDPDEYIESLYNIAEISHNQGSTTNALKEFGEVITKFKEFRTARKQVDEYIPAKAQYMIAEINFEKYKAVQIVPPLDVSFNKKTQLLKVVLNEYGNAGKFKVADWTTAALYKSGITVENLAEAVLNSPTPDELNPQEKKEYMLKLNEQQVIPLKRKALEYYKANVASAEKNNIQNEWVENSKQRMEKLIIELGLGTGLNSSGNSNNTKIVPASQRETDHD
ncbi:MAG: tetratricopeptide repeat protein [Candidatus Zhuqueibacterota bacterium]